MKKPAAKIDDRMVPFAIALPPSELDELRAVAEEEDRSVSWCAREAIRLWLKERANAKR